ncbi:hypothetical protein OMP43_14575 [Sphingomonas sp. CBMAI 2297]|nr:hypothetical protein [Sphingomonas sp. CBMAI 2297]MDH4745243.1 hypothetical protein [Sphingomonas sp. CBMAI 2297]
MRSLLALMALALAGCGQPKVVFENTTTVPEHLNDTAGSDAAH